MAIHARDTAQSPKDGFVVIMVAESPLEEVRERLVAAGFDGGRICEENFGPSLRVVDPDGNELQINDQ